MQMNNALKIALMALVCAYVVSPVDIAPGPIDDALVLLLSLAASRSLPRK